MHAGKNEKTQDITDAKTFTPRLAVSRNKTTRASGVQSINRSPSCSEQSTQRFQRQAAAGRSRPDSTAPYALEWTYLRRAVLMLQHYQQRAKTKQKDKKASTTRKVGLKQLRLSPRNLPTTDRRKFLKRSIIQSDRGLAERERSHTNQQKYSIPCYESDSFSSSSWPPTSPPVPPPLSPTHNRRQRAQISTTTQQDDTSHFFCAPVNTEFGVVCFNPKFSRRHHFWF